MVDVFTAEKRSRVMSAIRSTATAAEEVLYGVVRNSIGGRWRIDRNVNTLPGKPDIVIPTLRVAIFCDGCFYHNCPYHGHIPKSNTEYWIQKLRSNHLRDRRNRRELRRLGFSVWRVWEHGLEGRQLYGTAKILEKRLCGLIKCRIK